MSRPTTHELLQHADFVRRVAAAAVGEDLADDVVQETYLAALRRPPRSGSRVRAWLAAVARNAARMVLRSQARRRVHEQGAARPDRARSTAEAVSRVELHGRVVAEVLELDEPYRLTVIHRYFDNLPPREIARIMGVPVGTVGVRLRRALEQLKGRMDKSYGRAWALLLLPALDARALAATGATVMGKKTAAVLVSLVLMLALFVGIGVVVRKADETQPRRAARTARPGQGSPSEASEVVAALPHPVDLNAVDRDRDLHGIVVTREGAPVAGARVETFFLPWQRCRIGPLEENMRRQPGPVTRTARDGTFALGLSPGDLVQLHVGADGLAPRSLRWRQAGERVRVVLTREARLVVRVVRESGATLPGARLRLRHGILAKNFDLDPELVERTGVTNELGRCVFAGLAGPGEARLHAEHAGHGWAEQMVVFDEGMDTFVEIALPRGRMVSGRVLDAETRKPLAGAEVGLWSPPVKVTRTDGDGVFRIAGYAADKNHQKLWARAEGYGLVRVWIDSLDPLRYRRLEGKTFVPVEDEHDVEILLQRGASVAGRVVDARRQPIAGAWVAATGGGAYGVLDPRAARTGEDGLFLLAGLNPLIRRHSLVVMAPGHGRVLYFIDPDDGAVYDLGDIQLPPAQVLDGRVVSVSERPVPRVRLTLKGSNDDRDRYVAGNAAGSVSQWWGDSETRWTDDLGRFRFPDLAPGAYELSVWPAGRPPVRRVVRVAVGIQPAIVELRLAYTFHIAVRVIDTTNMPVAGAGVAFHGRRDQTFATTGADGYARQDLPESVEQLSVWSAPGVAEFLPVVREAVDEGAAEVVVRVRRLVPARGRAVDSNGEPIAGLPLGVYWDERRIAERRTDGDGRFEVPVPVDEQVDVRVEAASFSGNLPAVAPWADGLILRAVSVARDGTLIVRVTSPDGSALQGARVSIFPSEARGVTGRDGRVKFAGLPARESTVRAYLDLNHLQAGRWVPPAPIRVEPTGQEVVVTFAPKPVPSK